MSSPATNKMLMYGLVWKYSPDQSTYTQLGLTSTKDIDLGEDSAPAKDVSYLTMTNSVRQKAPGIVDSGEMSLNMWFVQAEYATVRTLVGVLYYFRVILPLIGSQVTNAQWNGIGIITKLGRGKAGFDEYIECPIQITCSDLWVLTQGS